MSDESRSNTSILVTPVSITCNLGCRYCFHRDGQIYNLGTGKMSLATLENLTSQAALFSPRVRFIWHGGEPTLAGLEFFEQALQYQGSQRAKFVNTIQTNGTLLDANWIEFFLRHGFHVGISIDGPREIHDKQRVSRSGVGTFHETYKFIQKARESQLNYGALCVITKNSLGRESEIFSFFSTEFKSFDFLPYYEANPQSRQASDLTITATEYAEFMINMFDLWIKHDDPQIKVRSLMQWMQAVLGLDMTLCRFNGSCAEYITIDANGDVYPCDRFNGEHKLLYGNINEVSLDEIFASEEKHWFGKIAGESSDECNECRWLNVCHGDCVHYRYQGDGKFAPKSYYCESQKRILDHVHTEVSALADIIKEKILSDESVL